MSVPGMLMADRFALESAVDLYELRERIHAKAPSEITKRDLDAATRQVDEIRKRIAKWQAKQGRK